MFFKKLEMVKVHNVIYIIIPLFLISKESMLHIGYNFKVVSVTTFQHKTILVIVFL